MPNASELPKPAFGLVTDGLKEVMNTSSKDTENTPSYGLTWKLYFPITIMLIAAELWMTASFLVFQLDNLRRKKKKKQSQSAAIITASTMLLLLFPFPRLTLTLSLAFIGYQTSPEINYLCEVVIDVSIIAYGFAFILICTSLWLRQRIIYSQLFLRAL